MSKLIRIFPDQLGEIIHDKLISVAFLDEEDADECLIAIMEDISKNETFRQGRR